MTAAWRCRAAGMTVAVVDESPASGASTAAAGLLSPATELHPGEDDLLDLNLRAHQTFEAHVRELYDATGIDVAFRRCGTLLVARDADDMSVLDELHRLQSSKGLSVERLRGRPCREREPGLAPSVRGGISVDDDAQVDPAALTGALVTACEATGVAFVKARAAAVARRAERVVGVTTPAGDVLEGGTVVIAAGAWSAALRGVPEGPLPVRPVKGQLVRLRGRPPVAGRNIRGIDVYLVVREDGRVVVGATVEERGFDATVRAGAVYELLRDAAQLVPEVLELEVEGALAGLRPGTPDNAPIIGPIDEGVLVATGHYRNGILLSRVTADAIVEVMRTGRAPAHIAAFSPGRFATVGAAR